MGWYYPFAIAAAIPVALLVWFGLKIPEPTGEKPLEFAQCLENTRNRQLAGLFIASTAPIHAPLRNMSLFTAFDSGFNFKSSSLVNWLILARHTCGNCDRSFIEMGRLADGFQKQL